MGERSRELIVRDESTVISSAVLDAVVVDDGGKIWHFPDPRGSEVEVFSKTDGLVSQFVERKVGSRRLRG